MIRLESLCFLVLCSNGCGPSVPAICNQPDGPLHPYSTQAEQTALLLGRWVRCSGPSINSADTAGIEFVSDGTWHALQFDSANNLVRAPNGFDSAGTFVSFGTKQLNIVRSDGGTYIFAAAFEDNPRKMQLTGMT